MGLVLISAVPLLGASLLIVFGGQVERVVLDWIKVDPLLNPISWVWEWLSRVARYLLSFSATVLVTAMLYYFGPYRHQRWRLCMAGRDLGHRPVARRHHRLRLVRAQHRAL